MPENNGAKSLDRQRRAVARAFPIGPLLIEHLAGAVEDHLSAFRRFGSYATVGGSEALRIGRLQAGCRRDDCREDECCSEDQESGGQEESYVEEDVLGAKKAEDVDAKTLIGWIWHAICSNQRQ